MICGALPFAYFNNNNDSYSYQLVSNFHVPGSRLIFLAALNFVFTYITHQNIPVYHNTFLCIIACLPIRSFLSLISKFATQCVFT